MSALDNAGALSYIITMKTYKASKTQLRKLADLNVTESPRDYNHAAELLEARGWDRGGSVQVLFFDASDDARVNDQDYDR